MKDEIPNNIVDLPIFETIDEPPKDSISRLYLIDLENIEIPYCDCINYDKNGNPRCSLHKGRLQEFYRKSNVLYRLYTHPKDIKYHLEKEGRPYCNTRTIEEQIWLKTQEYVTCKNCLKSEFVTREREIVESQKNFKWNKKKLHVKMEELEMKPLKSKGKIKDLK